MGNLSRRIGGKMGMAVQKAMKRENGWQMSWHGESEIVVARGDMLRSSAFSNLNHLVGISMKCFILFCHILFLIIDERAATAS